MSRINVKGSDCIPAVNHCAVLEAIDICQMGGKKEEGLLVCWGA